MSTLHVNPYPCVATVKIWVLFINGDAIPVERHVREVSKGGKITGGALIAAQPQRVMLVFEAYLFLNNYFTYTPIPQLGVKVPFNCIFEVNDLCIKR